MSENMTLYDKLHLHLFEGKTIAESYLTEPELEVKRRVEAMFTKLLDDPTISEKALRTFIVQEFNVNERTTYRDLALVKALFGNFKKTSKEYYRHRVISILEWAVETAKTKKDYFGVIAAADKIGKYTRLDQNDIDDIPWEEIIPPSFEPTNDIEVLGFKRDPNIKERIKKLMKKHSIDVEVIE